MFKWFDKWFANKCRESWENAQDEEKYEDRPVARMRAGNRGRNVGIALATTGSTDALELQSQSTTFKMYHANGGTVIELRHYDDNKDRWDSSLHVIPKNEDLGKAIEHIITYEALKR